MTFEQVVFCTASHGFRCDVILVCASQNQCWYAMRRFPQPIECGKAPAVRQRQIGEDRPNILPVETFHTLGERRNKLTLERASFSGKQRFSKGSGMSWVVVYK